MSQSSTKAALVLLRSTSGKSIRELSGGNLPDDLTPYRAPAEATKKVRDIFERVGFEVFPDAMGLTLSIQAPASLFMTYFKVPEAKLTDGKPYDLETPDDLRELVEEITLLQPLEWV